MLTLSAIKNSGGAAQYYAKEDSYYLSEVDAKEGSLWLGKGASELNLKGRIEENELQKALEGKLPNGVIVGFQKDGKINHRPGYDVCFHAPKSVSILALDGGDKRFYNAHLEAVKETLKIIERDCAQAKIYKDGKPRFENTKNLSIALIRHTASREKDPHLHHHALVMNITKRSDSKWRSLASSMVKQHGEVNGFFERMYKNQIYYGLIYKASLANKVQKLGCEIEMVGKHGMWEIKGVSKEVRDVMSKRRKQIEESIKKLDYHSLKAADVAAKELRKEKAKNITLDEMKQSWKDELASVGFSSKEFIKSVDRGRDEKNLDTKEELKGKDFNIDKSAKEAVKDAVDHLSQYNLKLDYAKIISQALEFSIGKSTHSDMVQALNGAIKSGHLISLDKSSSLFVTKNLIETEKAIIEMVEKGKASGSAIKLKNKVIDSIDFGQAKEQAVKILRSSNRLNLVESRMSDNTEFISAILKLAESSGKTVRILSPNRMITNDINENIKRKPNNLWQWLVSLGKPELGESVAGFKHKYKQEMELSLFKPKQGKDVVVVNGSETLGCNDMHSLLELTEKTSAKVIFLQDLNARYGFSVGNSVETLKQAGMEVFRINKEEKKIDYMPELRMVKDDNERIRQLSRAYALREDKERDKTTVFVSSKRQLELTNKTIRGELKDRGKISNIDHSIRILNPVYMSKSEAGIAHRYQKNMILRFYSDNYAHEDWKVENINKEQNTLRLIRDGKRMLWDPKKQESNCAIFEKKLLQITKGDKLISTGNMRFLGIKNATKFTVQEVNDKNIKLLSGDKTIKVRMKDLEDSHFQYNYVTTINSSSKKKTDHMLADFKAFSLDKSTVNELTSRAKKSLTIFTNNTDVAQKRFGDTAVKLTGVETLLNAGKVDRLINSSVLVEIKKDIEKALLFLENENDLAKKAERKAVDFAIEKITSRNAGFTHKELVTEALTYAMREQIAIHGDAVTHEDIMRIITEKRDSGELVMGRHFDDGTRWTTKEILELEKAIIADVKKGINKFEPLLKQEKAQKFLEKTKLTQDQKNACCLITTTKDQFVMVQGYAGTGKTTMFSYVQDMLKEAKGIKQDVEIISLAPTHKTVKELKNRGMEAQTLQSFLIEKQKENLYLDTNDNKSKNVESSLNNKLIILDEDSMVSNKDFSQFLKIVGNRKARVVLSGDIAQHIAIGSGKPFEVVQRTNILKIVFLKEIIRQKNPNLKGAVEDVIHGNYASAFEKIANENPQQYVNRAEPEFFNNLKNSIVEIDNNKLKKGEKTIEEMVAEDFLSRTPETRDKTVVIVHANKDRKVVNDYIRKGLKDQGEIANKGARVNCLVPKGLTDTEHKSLQSYDIGDVVKFGKEYYRVLENDQLSKSILLKSENGQIKYFYPEKYVDKYNVELYKHEKIELANGDSIRLTKTDKERNLYANFEYKVKDVNKETVTFEGKDVNDNKNQPKEVTLNHNELKNAHWDYAYTVTGYGIQGGSKTFAIDLELSYRKCLTNLRSFYIAVSRAIKHLIIYTDNKNKLLNSVSTNKGDKYAALEVTGDLAVSNNNVCHGDIGDKTSKKTKHTEIGEKGNRNSKLFSNHYDAKEIKRLLNNSAESFVERLLGKPNGKLSSAYEWRYGSKGSLVINMRGDNRGLWHSFETGESGNLLTLLQKETGLSFRESLAYAANVFGGGSVALEQHKNYKGGKEDTNMELSDGGKKKSESKTSEYAKKLTSESISIDGTLVERYLKKRRGINDIDSSDIRYHSKVYVGRNEESKGQRYMPAMLAIGRDKDGNVQCVQATYLDSKTEDKADLGVKKRTYSSPSGASVSLQENSYGLESSMDKNRNVNKVSFITEGVETGLSIKEAVKNDNVIVALGKSNFANIDSQKIGEKVVFCLDNDGTKSLSDNVIHKAAQRLIGLGKEVFIAVPEQIKSMKTDFNDVAKVRGIDAVNQQINNAVSYEKFSIKFPQEVKNFGKNLSDISKNERQLSVEDSSFTSKKIIDNNKNIEDKILPDIQKNIGLKLDRDIEM